MKKRLLTLAAFVLAFVGSSFAFNVGEYAYNSTQKFRVLGENKVQNGNFAQGRDGWYGVDREPAPNPEVWNVVEAAGPNGENILQSLGATAGSPLTNSWTLDPGSYIVCIDVKHTAAVTTAILTAGKDASANTIDFFLNTDGNFTKVATADDAPVVNVASAQFVPAEEWKTLVWYCNVEQGQQLVMHIENLATDFQLTNINIQEAAQVYDTRIIERRIAFARQLMEDPNFNTDAAQDAKANLASLCDDFEGLIAAGEADDASIAEGLLQSFEDEGFKPFLDVTTQNIGTNNFFNYIEDLTKFPKYNRGQIADGQQIGGFIFRGGNWLHSSGGDVLAKQIQGTYTNGPGSVALYNTNLPAGKYFVAASMRNAYCDKNYVLTYNLENQVKAFVGSDTLDCGLISGEDWTTFYTIGEVKDGENVEAGFFWNDQAGQGSRFEIKGFEVRAFEDVIGPFEHSKAWDAFIAQWNAATSARASVEAKIGDANYPWEQDSLKAALAQWDPYYNEIVAKGWVTAEGTDAGVATTEELNEWAQYQGVELYSEPDEEGNVTRLEYQLVRGYQNANTYVVAANKPIADLADEIAKAESIRDDAENSQGDKVTYQKAIDAAQGILDDVLKNTSDAKREADEARIAAAIEALQAAEEAFKESGKIEPFVDIDFANNFEVVTLVEPAAEEGGEAIETDYYAIKGAKGQMLFNQANVELEDNTLANFYAKGYNEELTDVLRVGKAEAWVVIDEENIPTDNEVLRVGFDLWVGNLINRFVSVELRNAANERVGGFSLNRYNGTLDYNDFNDEAGTGINWLDYITGIGSSSASNVAICADNNKSHVELVADFKALGLQGKVENPQKGTFEGAFVPMPALEDTKVVKFVLSSTYENADRRCWFDNLTIKKYPSQAEGPIDNGIRTVNTAKVVSTGIYTISGVKVAQDAQQLPAGLYIINGKKVVVK